MVTKSAKRRTMSGKHAPEMMANMIPSIRRIFSQKLVKANYNKVLNNKITVNKRENELKEDSHLPADLIETHVLGLLPTLPTLQIFMFERLSSIDRKMQDGGPAIQSEKDLRENGFERTYDIFLRNLSMETTNASNSSSQTVKVNSKFCNGGHICTPPKECCPLGCCLVFASPGYRPTVSQVSQLSPPKPIIPVGSNWFMWGLVCICVFFCICGCGLWKRRQFLRLFRRRSSRSEERSDLDSTGSCYPPPQYSRCSSFHCAPPPYTEVTSKPDLYPLVISYKSDNRKLSGNCVMVQYFRNYVLHPTLGTLSAGTTVDSISSFFGQSVLEGDSSVPPTYEETRAGRRNSVELESLVSTNPIRCQQNDFLSQGQLLRNTGCENITERNGGLRINERQVCVGTNTDNSLHKRSSLRVESPKLMPTVSSTLKNAKTLQNSAESLPSNLYMDPGKNQKRSSRPSNLYISTFKKIQKSIIFSTSADSINENTVYPSVHQYSSDVILAQPQSYCESNDLHYFSSDILNNADHFLHSSEDNLSQPRGSLQDFVSSDGLSHSQLSNLEMNNFSTSSDVSSLQGCGTPDSPPQATTPTGEFRNLLDKIQQLPVQKESNRVFEGSEEASLESHSKNDIAEVTIPIEDSPTEENPLKGNEQENESDQTEKFCLLTVKPKTKKISDVSPNKLLGKQNFPSRSKTFYLPFCHGSLSLKRTGSCKLSTSAPVTPVTSLPSSSTPMFSFVLNPNKFGSKNESEPEKDSKPLLHDESESNDEVF